MDDHVFIVGACRTPIGAFRGKYFDVPATKLGGIVIQHVLERAKIDPADVSEIIMGHVLTAKEGTNTARQASISAKVPSTVPSSTVDMACGSGLKAVHNAFCNIKSGDSTIIVAGGMENMTIAKHCVADYNIKTINKKFEDSYPHADPFHDVIIRNTMEHLAKKHNISRSQQDEYAMKSHLDATITADSGGFEREVVPVELSKNAGRLNRDEYISKRFSVESITLHKPLCGQDGTVTSVNSARDADGAAAVVMCNGFQVKSRGLKPLAVIVAFSEIALDTSIEVGLASINAIQKVLEEAMWSIDDVEMFEVNDVAAVQMVAIIDALKIDPKKVNVSGGSISLGNPIGASGARILVTLLYNMERYQKSKGVAAISIIGGMGIAIAVQMM